MNNPGFVFAIQETVLRVLGVIIIKFNVRFSAVSRVSAFYKWLLIYG